MEKIIEEFLNEYLKRGVYSDRETLINILTEVTLLLRKNKDKSLEDIIDLIIKDNILEFEEIRKKYGVPGYTGSISVNKINVKMYGGNINYLGEEMPINALFDIASMTKFYTQVVSYNLIKEGIFKREDKIKDLDNRFVNLDDVTVDDILTFGTTFQTDGRISDKKTIDEALNTLYNVKATALGKWNYNDMGMMIIKEVMEHLTGLSYQELLDKYIVKPFNLLDTHIIVPRSKFHLITGTPNFDKGNINDATANAVGGFSGHAGIFATSDDLVKMAKMVRESGIDRDSYTKGKLNDAIGVMGNVYIANSEGLNKSFVDKFEPNDTFAISGSTRVNLASSRDAIYTVLFNPSSMSMEDAKMRIEKINEERKKENKAPLNPIREYEFDRNGKMVKYKLIDPRQIFPVDSMADVVSHVAKTTLKLRFLDFAVKKYDKEYQEIDINKKGL